MSDCSPRPARVSHRTKKSIVSICRTDVEDSEADDVSEDDFSPDHLARLEAGYFGREACSHC